MPAGQEIAFEPALAEMLAQDLHHPAVPRQMHVVGLDALHPDPIGRLEDGVEPVGGGLVRPHEAEIVLVQPDDVAQERSRDTRCLGMRVSGAGTSTAKVR